MVRTDIGQRFMQGTEEKVVYQALVPKTHLMLGRMYVDIHQRRIEFQVKHESRMPSTIKHIPIRLFNSM